jgi:hypothetical protein
MAAVSRPRLTLLVRAYCHLCDDMRAALAPLAAVEGCVVDEFDVDADPALEARWGSLVPVLLAGERELCHYHFDRVAWSAFFVAAGQSAAAGESRPEGRVFR